MSSGVKKYNPSELFPYELNNVHLSSVSSYKYLGIHISTNLQWHGHINYVTNNANRMLGFLRRNFPLAPVSLKLLLYKTLVRSKLEYASSIWDPHMVVVSSSLEAIQNRAARFIVTNYSRTASITSIKSSLKLSDLAARRKIARLCLFHKIYFTNPILKQALISAPSYNSARNDHRFKVGVPKCRANPYFYSFIPKTCDDWNHLPASIASIPDPTSFKTAVTNIV